LPPAIFTTGQTATSGLTGTKNNHMPYTQIASFAYPTDPVYILLVARLRHEGIEHAMADEITINADPLLSQAIGGVKVKVHVSDMARAREIYEAILQEQQQDEGITEEELANLAASFAHPDTVVVETHHDASLHHDASPGDEPAPDTTPWMSKNKGCLGGWLLG